MLAEEAMPVNYQDLHYDRQFPMRAAAGHERRCLLDHLLKRVRTGTWKMGLIC